MAPQLGPSLTRGPRFRGPKEAPDDDDDTDADDDDPDNDDEHGDDDDDGDDEVEAVEERLYCEHSASPSNTMIALSVRQPFADPSLSGSIHSADKPGQGLPGASLIDSFDSMAVVIARKDVEASDVTRTLAVLNRLLESQETARRYCERVDIGVHGYDADARELWEILELRDFVNALDGKFPYWLFFLSKHGLGLQCLLLCLLPPFLTPEAKARVFPERIGDLLERRWFPAMNHVCEFANMDRRTVEQLTNHAVAYVLNGRRPLES